MDKKSYLKEIDRVIAEGPYKDTWDSLSTHPIPQWYQEAKLGFFIHWGIYSVPAYFTEWYPRLMYYRQNPVYWHHLKHYGKSFEYHDFIPLFKAEKFNPEEWLDLLEPCLADFIMPAAEHHDGFKMYKSEINHWNAAEMGPKRDILGDLKTACDKRNIRLAASSHRAEHYWFMNGGQTLKRQTATENEGFREFYGPCVNPYKKNNLLNFARGGNNIIPSQEWLEEWLVSSCELIDRYQLSNSYFDSWAAEEAFRPYMRKFLAYYYNRAAQWGKEVVSFYKFDAALYPCGVYVRERGLMEGISQHIWQCETSTASNAWSYCTTNKYKKPEAIICNMIDVWSKNGCMALNIGPKADGTICEEEKIILKALASWLQKNKTGIWGTVPHRMFGEGKKQKTGSFKENYHYTKNDFRFTYRLGKLYAFALTPKGQKTFQIQSLAKVGSFSHVGACNCIVKNASILGEDIHVTFQQTKKYLKLVLDRPVSEAFPICFELTVE